MIVSGLESAVKIFAPGKVEINAIFDRAYRSTPEAAHKRLGKAHQLLLDGKLEVDEYTLQTGNWYVFGSKGERYHVTRQSCDCPDFTHRGERIGNKKACKHTLALRAYFAIIEDELARLIASGRVGVTNAARKAEHIPEQYLTGYKVGSVQVELRNNRWRLSNNRGAAVWARNLARIVLEELAEPEPEPEFVPVAPEWRPTLTNPQYQRWLESGNVAQQ